MPLHTTAGMFPLYVYVCMCTSVRVNVCVRMDLLFRCVRCYYGIRFMCARFGIHTYWTRCLQMDGVLLYTQMHRERALKSHLGVFTYTQILGKACDFYYSSQIVQYILEL